MTLFPEIRRGFKTMGKIDAANRAFTARAGIRKPIAGDS
jgi:hypothetical protein